MIRASLAIWAGAGLALFAAGCAGTNMAGLFFAQSTGPNGERVVAGSLETVATGAQATLSQLGLHAVVTRQGEAIHISSRTKNGANFTLVLTREQTKPGEQTHIRLQWGDGRDDEAGVQILSEVTAKARG
jgi:hypothetical protein